MCGRRVAGWPLHGEASQTVEMKPKKLYFCDSQSSTWSQFSVAFKILLPSSMVVAVELLTSAHPKWQS
jgi:hypothetical protein